MTAKKEKTVKKETALVPVQTLPAPVKEDAIDIPVADLKKRLAAIRDLQKLVRSQMVDGKDFGPIKGVSDKPVLFKPGAEKVVKLLGLADIYLTEDVIRDFDKPLFHYEIKCQLFSIKTGVLISEGVGECNSMESKYAFRWLTEAKLPAELKAIKDQLKSRERSGQYGKYKQYRIPNDDIFSQVNTIKKMSKKRALVDAALSVGRLSELFTQDLEEMSPDYIDAEVVEEKQVKVKVPKKPATPKAKPAPKPKKEETPEQPPWPEQPSIYPTVEPGAMEKALKPKAAVAPQVEKRPVERISEKSKSDLSIADQIKQDFSIRFGQLKNQGWKEKYKAFKNFLFNVLGPQKKRSFAGTNQFGHISLEAADQEDLQLAWDNAPFTLGLWMQWEKEQKEKEKEDDSEIPF